MICTLCPRRCGALRTEASGNGFCGMPALPVVARAMLHQWEEPCISGSRGSGAADYFETAAAAIREMHRQAGDCVMEDGLLKRGVVIRHLLLPGALDNAKAVMDWVAASFRPGQVLFSLMSQYTPQPGAEGLLSRRVTGGEYRAALAYMENLGILDGYRQDSSSAKEEYTPAFDLSGI